MTPALALLVVVALLHDDTSNEASIFEALALMPIFWMALYGTLRQLVIVVLGAILIFLLPGLMGGNDLADSLWRSAFVIAFAGLVVLVMEVSHISDLRASSDERLRSVVETMPEGLVVVDETGRTVMSNRAAHELLTSDSESATLIAPLSQVISGEPVEEQEIEFPTPTGGNSRWIGVSGKPLQDAEGHPAGGIAVFHDITERKQAEQYRWAQYNVSRALAQAFTLDEALDRLLEALGTSLGWQLGVFWSVEVKPVMSRSIGRPVRSLHFDRLWSAPGIDASRVERTCSKLTFSSPIGLLGRVWEGAAPAWELELDGSHSERIKAVTSLGMTGSICFPVIARDRVLGVVEFFVDGLTEPRGDLAGVLAAIGSQLGEFIERMRAEQEADRDKDAFFGLVSHELRTPLTSIIGYLDLVLQEEGDRIDDEAKRHLEIARRNSDRLLRLVGDLLLVAQVQTGRFSHETAPVNLGLIAQACVEAARPADSGEGCLPDLHRHARRRAERRLRSAQPAVRQPDLERDQVHRARRADRGARQQHRRPGDLRGVEHRQLHPARGGRAAVRAVLQGVERDRAGRAGRRARARDREGDRRSPRWQHPLREPRGSRHHLPLLAAARPGARRRAAARRDRGREGAGASRLTAPPSWCWWPTMRSTSSCSSRCDSSAPDTR